MKRLLQDQAGVALIMVMSALIILMALWGEFTFESKISRIKTTNIMDKTQSKLVAESGIELAMIRLRLFKEAFNLWENNENAKNTVQLQLVNQLWEAPFIYPIPLLPGAGAQAKAAINEFQKEAILEGELKVSIQNISNKLNINMMRVSFLQQALQLAQTQAGAQGGLQAGDDGDPNTSDAGQAQGGVGIDQPGAVEKDPNFSMDQQLVRFLMMRIQEKGEEDEAFREKYGSIDPLQLVANLKFYISDRNPRRQNQTQIDMLMDNSEQIFNEAKISPKFGPMTSFNEIYLIPGWDDALVNIIKNEFDVFPSVMIDLNKITGNMLRLLIPNINENEVAEFFKFRDNPQRPVFLNNLQDFKNYIVNSANLMQPSEFDTLFGKFEAQGIRFGAAPTLFRIISEGKVERSTTTLTATVSLPTMQNQAPAPTAGVQGGANAGQQGDDQTGAQGGADPANPSNDQTGAQGGVTGGAAQTTQLLEPRIIDLQVN
jgi:hypothetical protein